MEQKKKLTKEEKRQLQIDGLKLINVNALSGKTTMHNLCCIIGIKERKQYYCHIEKPRKKGEQMTAVRPTVKLIHDFGFVFNNGFEINGVEKSVFKLFPDIEIMEVKKRHNSKLHANGTANIILPL